MAQGTVKPNKSGAATGRRPSALGPKKGARTIAPKRQVLVRNAKMTKVGFPYFLSFLWILPRGDEWALTAVETLRWFNIDDGTYAWFEGRTSGAVERRQEK